MDVKTVHKHYKQSTTALSTSGGSDFNGWLREAEDWYKIVTGDQWDSKDLSILKQEGRPSMTFNRSGVMHDVVAGLEIQNKMEPTYFPREVDDRGKSDIMNSIFKWVHDDSDFDDEESLAFGDLLTCGMGWSLTTMDYTVDMEGKIEKICVDPLRCRWDVSNTRKNLKGSRWRMYIMDMHLDEIERRWPKVELGETGGPWDADIDKLYGQNRYLADQTWKYDQNLTQRDTSGKPARVVLYQYMDFIPMYRVQGEPKLLSKKEFNDNKAYIDGAGLQYIPQSKRVVRQMHVVGSTELDKTISPTEDYTLECMTGKYDKANRCYYGITRPMKDPQLWMNKFVSSILDIIASNAKGGIMAEVGAFQDERKAKEEWSRANSVVMLDHGGIGKVVPKPVTGIPTGIQYLLEYTGNMFPHTSGISLEMMGLVQHEQAGVLEHQRKQAGLSILAWAFSALRSYRKSNAKTVMELVRKFMPDGRMIRINSQAGEEMVQVVRDQLAERYDVIVDESPSSVSQVERTWEVLREVIPLAMKMGIPVPPQAIKYLPLPERLKSDWMSHLNQMQQQEQSEAEKAEVQKTQSEAERNQATTQLNIAKAAEISQESESKIVERMAKARLDAAKAGRETANALMGT